MKILDKLLGIKLKELNDDLVNSDSLMRGVEETLSRLKNEKKSFLLKEKIKDLVNENYKNHHDNPIYFTEDVEKIMKNINKEIDECLDALCAMAEGENK